MIENPYVEVDTKMKVGCEERDTRISFSQVQGGADWKLNNEDESDGQLSCTLSCIFLLLHSGSRRSDCSRLLSNVSLVSCRRLFFHD